MRTDRLKLTLLRFLMCLGTRLMTHGRAETGFEGSEGSELVGPCFVSFEKRTCSLEQLVV